MDADCIPCSPILDFGGRGGGAKFHLTTHQKRGVGLEWGSQVTGQKNPLCVQRKFLLCNLGFALLHLSEAGKCPAWNPRGVEVHPKHCHWAQGRRQRDNTQSSTTCILRTVKECPLHHEGHRFLSHTTGAASKNNSFTTPKHQTLQSEKPAIGVLVHKTGTRWGGGDRSVDTIALYKGETTTPGSMCGALQTLQGCAFHRYT